MNTVSKNKLIAILTQKCPSCGIGKVYNKTSGPFVLPQMKDCCEVCNHHFDREPGYFIGAMYASYALAVFEGIVTFLVTYLCFTSISTLSVVLSVVSVIVLLSLWNYRMSRIIWMNLFP